MVSAATLGDTKAEGDPLLDRSVTLRIRGLADGRYRVTHHRIDEHHSNIAAAWGRLADGRDWPDEAGWDALREADCLDELEPPCEVETTGGALDLAFELPMPAISFLRIDGA